MGSRRGNGLRSQSLIDGLDLFSGFFYGAAVVDHVVGGLDLSFLRGLGHHAAIDFLARYLGVLFMPLRPALDPLLRLAGYDNNPVETAAQACFQQQGGLKHHNGVRLAAAETFHPLLVLLNDAGMHDAIQLVNSRAAFIERELSQTGAVDGLVRIQDFVAKLLNNFVINGPRKSVAALDFYSSVTLSLCGEKVLSPR